MQWRTVGSTRWSSRGLNLTQSGCPSTESDHPYCAAGYSYTLPSLTTGRAYEVQVLAVNGNGNGQWSTPVTDTPGESFKPASADIIAIGSAGDFNIQAQWNAPITSIAITNYNVQWRTCGTTGYSCRGWGSSRNTADNSTTNLEYPGSRLTDGVYYQARVRTNGAGSTGGSSGYAESPKYRVDINDGGTPRDLTDDTLSITVLS